MKKEFTDKEKLAYFQDQLVWLKTGEEVTAKLFKERKKFFREVIERLKKKLDEEIKKE